MDLLGRSPSAKAEGERGVAVIFPPFLYVKAGRSNGTQVVAEGKVVNTDLALRGGTDLWRIGRVDVEVVGVILPTANDGGPVLNYIGVVPEHRGKGLVDDFLHEAARLHAEAGAQRVRADSDDDNLRMHAAFTRAGWREFGRRTSYRLDLNE